MIDKTVTNKDADANRDPITKEPGAHPVGVGVGAAAGGMAAGAAVGTVAGPVGTAVGAAVGAVIGGLAGKGVAEAIDPTAEDAYWRENYASRDYVAPGRSYSDYGPAYGYGVSHYQRDRSFEDLEPELAEGWMGERGTSSLGWGEASHAARDAWDRVDRQTRERDRAQDA
jgi:hypothetical protein